MTTAEHLEKIKAKCRANLALAEKRTPGDWIAANLGEATEATVRAESGFIVCTVNQFAASFGDKKDQANAAYIAACAGAAEAGWRSTIAAIDRLAFDTTANAEVIKLILSFWPEETL